MDVDVVVAVLAVEVVVVVGGAQPPPFANTFITGSGFLKTSLPGVKKTRGLGRAQPPPICKPLICKQTACMMT